MMALFIYDSQYPMDVQPDRELVRTHCHDLVQCGVSSLHFRSAVRTMMNHQLLVVPRSLDRQTPVIQRLINIAHLSGVTVQNLGVYASTNKHALRSMAQQKYATNPVVASAVPATQHPAAAGNPSSTY